MNTTKHTTGTWSAYNAKGGNIYKNWRVKSSAGRLIATIEEQPIGDEEVYNSALIAAAPVLLEALKSAVTRLEKLDKLLQQYADTDADYELGEVLRARDAIAKAEGR